MAVTDPAVEVSVREDCFESVIRVRVEAASDGVSRELRPCAGSQV